MKRAARRPAATASQDRRDILAEDPRGLEESHPDPAVEFPTRIIITGFGEATTI